MKTSALFSLITTLLLVFTTACSVSTSAEPKIPNISSPSKTSHSTSQNEKKQPTNKESGDKKSTSGDEKSTLNKKNSNPTKVSKPKQPFTPVLPSKNAKSLLLNYTNDQIKLMPIIEAHGETRNRSVAFGETLQQKATDNTSGPLKKYRLVSFYGNPHSTHMGILGELKPDVYMKKLKAMAQAYSNADPSRPAIPTIELITTIAQRNPGSNGLYYHETSLNDIKEYAKLAKDNGAILLLDVQLGRDTVMHQVKLLEKYLKLPYVYLAIDTEFHVHKGQIPGVQLGHVDGRNIEKAIQYVSELVKKNHLPNKVVLVHQFKGDIIQHKDAIKPTDNTEVVLNVDGFGTPGTKMAVYHGLVRNETVQYGGFKLFFKNDKPLLTPKQVLMLDPAPAVIDYQ